MGKRLICQGDEKDKKGDPPHESIQTRMWAFRSQRQVQVEVNYWEHRGSNTYAVFLSQLQFQQEISHQPEIRSFFIFFHNDDPLGVKGSSVVNATIM